MRIIGILRAAAAAALIALAAAPGAARAAEESVGDIREELGMLNRQIQEIRTALVATGAASGLSQDPATALQRVDQLEQRLRQLTNRVDVLVNDLDRVVKDASNRVEDIEFRLTELEGGDVSLLGEGEALGGGLTETAAPAQPVIPPVSVITGPGTSTGISTGTGAPTLPTAAIPAPTLPRAAGEPGAAPQLAVGERADFEAAKTAFESGQHAEAVERLDAFLAAYPVGPFSSEAQAMKADALAAQGEWRNAARTYLDTFSGAPDAPTAPKALHGLAISLGRLGQTEEACLTLAEVDIRYPGSAVASDVAETRASIGCR